MATAAQVLANRANAQHATGPRTDHGKANSSRNSTTHGFTTGVLKIDAEDRPYFDVIEAAIIGQIQPKGALEMDAVYEFRDAAWRLRQIRKMTLQLFADHAEDPFTNPESAAAMCQLARYRAAAEMSLHRALNTLRDLQTIRLGRIIHLAKSENETIGPLASPKVFAFPVVDGMRMNRVARENFDEYHGIGKPS